MLSSPSLALLAAQAGGDTTSSWWVDNLLAPYVGDAAVVWVVLLVLVLLVALSIFLGYYIARSIRMVDYGWKLAVIFASVTLGSFLIVIGWPPRLGIDLQGGAILVYEVDEEYRGMDTDKMEALVTKINRRLNPGGVNEIVVRQRGQDEIEIIIPVDPDEDPAEIERVKQQITTAGMLRFRIVADREKHKDIIELSRDDSNRGHKIVKDAAGREVGIWVRVDVEDEAREVALGEGEPRRVYPIRVHVLSDTLRGKDDKPIPYSAYAGLMPSAASNDETGDKARYWFSKWLVEQGHVDKDEPARPVVEVLMALDDFNVTGEHLANVRQGYDEFGSPDIEFTMTTGGSELFGGLTGTNVPDPNGTKYKLGIVIDDVLLTAPTINETISSQGRITGDFSAEEVRFYVTIIRGGSLPATLNRTPISENTVGSLLGADTIEKGKWAIGASLVLVLVFMLVYYRFAGVIACLALVINLVLIVGVMVMFKAAFTLPGLAGLVLTVGMSVDANVLIFERIREEMARGSALRMAIRNGFSRATSTIVDANLTTLITSIVLYAIGTDQIRGFAVTLILGIVMSMFTAIFVSRVIFDICERKRWIKGLAMMRILGETNFDFMNKKWIAGGVSIVLIVIGMAALVARGKNILDIDFAGGSSVDVVLAEPVDYTEMRGHLQAGFDDAARWKKIRAEIDQDTLAWFAGLSAEELQRIKEDLGRENVNVGRLSDDERLEMARQARFGRDFGQTEEYDDNAPGPIDWTLTRLDIGGRKTGTMYKLDSSLRSAEYLKAAAEKMLVNKSGESLLESYQIPDPFEKSVARRPDDGDGAMLTWRGRLPVRLAGYYAGGQLLAQDEPEPPGDDAAADDAPANDAAADDAPPEPPPVEDDPPADAAPPPTSNDPDAAPADDPGLPPPAGEDPPPSGDTPPPSTGETPGAEDPPPGEAALPGEETPLETDSGVSTTVTLDFDPHKIVGWLLVDKVKRSADRTGIAIAREQITVSPGDSNWTPDSSVPYSEWELTLPVDEPQAKVVVAELRKDLAKTYVWETSSKIGGKVAGDTTMWACAALALSLLGIIGYIWFRFQKVIFGVAAVLALVHDVLITLGAIAVSAWLAGFMGWAMIDPFKISLPVTAAILTIIGYSLNDTIVIFDRIREVRGKSPGLDAGMINVSVNQTLSRTLLTSLTTLIVVVVLYFFGGSGIHGFAFCLVIGVVAGTYSTIFIASPALLWMWLALSARPQVKAEKKKSPPSREPVPAGK